MYITPIYAFSCAQHSLQDEFNMHDTNIECFINSISEVTQPMTKIIMMVIYVTVTVLFSCIERLVLILYYSTVDWLFSAADSSVPSALSVYYTI